MSDKTWKMLVHGGAGVITRARLGGDQEARYRLALHSALEAGATALRDGASAMDAACSAVAAMEDDPLFNAGRGSVFTADGHIEMDAAVMSGIDRSAGAICGVVGIRHPILAARRVMEDGTHVLLTGKGAEEFARQEGLDFAPSEWFETEHRRRQLEAARARDEQILDHDGKFGTVGAVALDSGGNLAAATSTGGMTNKRFGRVGDSPLIGAGTYADNRSLAVSATGQGEAFIRSVAAFRLAVAWELSFGAPERDEVSPDPGDGQDSPALDLAARKVLEDVRLLGGSGGLIALDSRGNWAMPFNTEGMFRGMAGSEGGEIIGIYE
jgi:beta-aspartyl-peptidase (threonine type)